MLKFSYPVALHDYLTIVLLHVAYIRHHRADRLCLSQNELSYIPYLGIYPCRHVQQDGFGRIVYMVQKAVDIHGDSLEVPSGHRCHDIFIQLLLEIRKKRITLNFTGLDLFFIHTPLGVVSCFRHGQQRP